MDIRLRNIKLKKENSQKFCSDEDYRHSITTPTSQLSGARPTQF